MKKKSLFFIYDECVFFEIILLAYFLKTTREIDICSFNCEEIGICEGFTVLSKVNINNIDFDQYDSFILTGGEQNFDSENKRKLTELITNFHNNKKYIGGICSGAEFIKNIECIQKMNIELNDDVTIKENIILAQPNKYVDFALVFADKVGIFKDREDYLETVDFFKHFKGC